MSGELTLELMREAARLELETIAELRKTTWDQHTSAYNWLTASLLAINGGAAAAILSSKRFEQVSVGYCLSALIVGILLAMLSARLNQHFLMKSMPTLQQMSGFWMSVFVTGIRDEHGEEELKRRAREAVRGAWIGQAAAWLSSIAFVSGVVLAALAIK